MFEEDNCKIRHGQNSCIILGLYENLCILGTQLLLHLIETETENHRKCIKE